MRSFVVLLVMLVASSAEAAHLAVVTPGGRLEMRNLLPANLPTIPIPEGLFQTPKLVVESSGTLCWIGFLYSCGDTLRWPRGQRVVLILKDSTEVADSLVIVSQPLEAMTMRPTNLRAGAVIASSELWRRGGGDAVIVNVGFPWRLLPRGFTTGEVADVRVGVRGDGVPLRTAAIRSER